MKPKPPALDGPRLRAVPIDELTLDPENAREHSAENLAAIAASLAAFGQQRPLIIDAAGKVLAGNGTLLAARMLGIKRLSCIETDLAGLKAKAYAIADNRTAELSEWDYHALALAVGELPAGLLDSIGFSAEQRASLEAIGKQLEKEHASGAGKPKPITCPRCGAVQ